MQYLFDAKTTPAASCCQRHSNIFAWKDESEEEYWWCVEQTIKGPDGWTPNLILDDGGDLTGLMHDKYPELMKDIIGVSRKRPQPGYLRLYNMEKDGTLMCPAIQCQRLGDKIEIRQLSMDVVNHSWTGSKERPMSWLPEKLQCRCRIRGDVGKGSAQSLRGLGATVWITEIDPICALQAAMEGYRVVTMDDACSQADIFVTATGNYNVIDKHHLEQMKDQTIVCNIGHFDNEINVESMKDHEWVNIKPQVDHIVFPYSKKSFSLLKGVW